MDISPNKKLFHGKNDDGIINLLGEDLLLEILSKLSVKSLLLCRSVSKTWYALTKSDYFIDKHFVEHHRHRLESRHHYIFIERQYNLDDDVFPYEFALLCDEKQKLTNLRSPFLTNEIEKRFYGLRLLGSSNGLVCFCFMYKFNESDDREEEFQLYQQTVIIWNPATEQYRELPKPNAKICNIPFSKYEIDDLFDEHYPIPLLPPLVGFDFINDHGDMIVNEYKLARVFSHASVNDDKTTFQAQIFMQNTNSWRQVRNELVLGFQLRRRVCDYPITLNSVLYWTMQKEGNELWYIMSFDLCEEVFRLIELPTDVQNEKDENGPDLCSWRNSLATATYNQDADCHIVWVMSKNENTAWSQQFKIKDVTSSRLHHLIRTTWDDQLLFASRCSDEEEVPRKFDLFSYNLQTKTQRNILRDASIHVRNVNYIESLAHV